MRINTATQLRKEITALDLALKMLRAETEGLRRSTVTLKKAVNAPLALWESHWFEALPQHEQDMIEKTARNISNALKPAPVINNTTTSATPVKPALQFATQVKPAIEKPAKRKPSKATNRNARWTVTDDKNLMRMVKAKETHQHMAMVMGRSIGSIQQRIKILKKGK